MVQIHRRIDPQGTKRPALHKDMKEPAILKSEVKSTMAKLKRNKSKKDKTWDTISAAHTLNNELVQRIGRSWSNKPNLANIYAVCCDQCWTMS